MTRDQSLRQQAASLMAAIIAIRREARRAPACGRMLAGLLSQFEQLLLSYFERQERELTPRLLESELGSAVMTGREFAAELEDLRKMGLPYFRNWRMAASIEAQADSFRYESDLVLGAIENRLSRECQQLYPAAEEAARLRAA